jgi:ABC-type sugar transport system ATPase subunit
MAADPYYQMWSSLRRSAMEMRQQAGRALVLRQAEALRDRARSLNAGAPTLRLDATVAVPRYQSALDNHCMPGSYFAEYLTDDVAAAANYDAGMFATTTGLFGRLGRDGHTAVDRAMERTGVTDLAHRQLLELSGGQRQRVLVAQGLASEADLLVLDEPMTGLDVVSRGRILEVMDEERREGRTVVFSTHDLAEAAGADQIVLLAGRVVAAGPPDTVLTLQSVWARPD